jgi:hypothetical protein
VAGIIGAVGNNGVGVTGVCWNVKIMAVKITHDDSEGSEAFTSNAIEGIEYAVDKNAKVINASWTIGGNNSQALKDAILDADAAGVLFIAAAGNNSEGVNIDGSYPAYPACYDCNNIITVMATTSWDSKASYSNYGPISVDLGAPGGDGESGDDILSAIPGGGYGFKNGTSMAAPHVAGACALVWAVYPLLTHLEVKEAILESVDDFGYWCVSGGRLNVYNAVTYYNHPLDITLTKTDDINTCVDPSVDGFIDNLINYTICYNADGYSVNDVNIIDYLPAYVDFNSCTGGGVYDINTHRVRWSLGDLDANDANCFTLTVRVAEDAIPGHYITNTTKMYSGTNLVKTTTEQTFVCCHNTIVYVDSDANGAGNGIDWPNAHNELRDALADIKAGDYPCAEQIWVAAGTYKPTDDANNHYATFEMIDDVYMYGHFAGNETSIDQRNLADANYATILSGDINGNGIGDANRVVTAADGRLDGFTVEKSRYWDDSAGIFCSGCSTAIANCILTNNTCYGIRCENGANTTIINTFINNNNATAISGDGSDAPVSINIDRCTLGSNSDSGLNTSLTTVNTTDCIFSGNGGDGIYTSKSNLIVERCDVNDNDYSGIYCFNSSIMVRDSIIHHNALKSGYGIYLDSNQPSSAIRNNTIVYNYGYGIRKVPGTADPNINSNIIWGNGDGINDSLYGGTFNKVNYNCIQGGWAGGIGNINNAPCFMDAEYHLSDDSNCIDAGDPNFVAGPNETDIDGEDRIMDGDRSGAARVDIGADEFYHVLADIYPEPPDGIVDFLDFAVFARSWMTSQGQPDYNDICDFYDDGVIDYKDLYIFCCDWLWITIWD